MTYRQMNPTILVMNFACEQPLEIVYVQESIEKLTTMAHDMRTKTYF